MILFVMAKLPLTARTIRGQLSSRKRPPTAERNHCKQSRRVKPAGTHAGQYPMWGSQSWLSGMALRATQEDENRGVVGGRKG